jgi:hypothetical protein
MPRGTTENGEDGCNDGTESSKTSAADDLLMPNRITAAARSINLSQPSAFTFVSPRIFVMTSPRLGLQVKLTNLERISTGIRGETRILEDDLIFRFELFLVISQFGPVQTTTYEQNHDHST